MSTVHMASPLCTVRMAPNGYKIASDAEGFGPESSVGRIARPGQGTSGTTTAMNTANDYGYVFDVPFIERSCTVCAEGKKGNFLLVNLNNEIDHVREYHPEARTTFRCKHCGKDFPKKLSALNHCPKCPSRSSGTAAPSTGDHCCDICGRGFKSKIGVGQHKRLAHRDEWNEVRRETVEKTKGKGSRNFTDDEVSIMLDLEVKYLNEPSINKLMTTALPGKTAEQIRWKRKLPRYKEWREERLRQITPDEGSSETTADAEDVESTANASSVVLGVSNAPLETPTIVVTPPDSDKDEQWLDRIHSNAQADEHQSPLSETLKTAISLARDAKGEVTQAQVDHVYALFERELTPKPTDAAGGKPGRKGNKSRRSKRRYIYARTQDLFKKSPGLLAKMVRNGTDFVDEGCPISENQIGHLYDSLWGTKPDVRIPDIGSNDPPTLAGEALPFFTADEIGVKIKAFKASTAAGPDGIKKASVNRKLVFRDLALLFNFVLMAGKQPSAWRKNRTILIPKEGKDGSKIENYRPITVNSIIARCFWGLIDQKLRAVVKMSPRQKGFVAEQGCYNNIHTLNEIIRHAKENKKQLIVTQLDISKAFDTVPHVAIRPMLARKGLPKEAIELVANSYKNISTEISYKGTKYKTPIVRGVKQGDPLSPLVFNLIIEPLLLQLEGLNGYPINEATRANVLAFADDLILVAGDEQIASEQLELTERYLGDLGMSISAPKCCTFKTTPTKDAWYISDPDLRIGTEKVPYKGANATLTYLGVEISPWKGIETGRIVEKLNDTLGRITKLALKPGQKLALVTDYVIPHHLYGLSMCYPSSTLIRQMDQDIRTWVKETMHLPACTANALLYCSNRDGGLCVPKLETIATASALRAANKYLSSEDPVMKALAETTNLTKRAERMAKVARINWPLEEGSLDAFKKREKSRHVREWRELKSQGKAVDAFTGDLIGNAWLANPRLLKPCRQITALKMRSNTCPVRTVMNRVAPQPDLHCRQCHSRLETLGHVLGECTATKRDRIHRHNEIRDLIADELARDNKVAIVKEATFEDPELGNLKPDLVIKSQERVFVVDVTVRHEDGRGLQRGFKEKTEKYGGLASALLQRFGVTSAKVLPIVIGTRGALPVATQRALKELGIADRKTLLTISLIALRNSIELYHRFMDYGKPDNRRVTVRHRESGRETQDR